MYVFASAALPKKPGKDLVIRKELHEDCTLKKTPPRVPKATPQSLKPRRTGPIDPVNTQQSFTAGCGVGLGT